MKQEFISSDPVEDIRLVFLGEEIVFSITRRAKEDSLFTNYHQGGSVRFNILDELDPEVVKKGRKIAKRFKIFGKYFFTADYMKDQKGQYHLIEINSMPGIRLYTDDAHPHIKHFTRKLIQYLRNEAISHDLTVGVSG